MAGRGRKQRLDLEQQSGRGLGALSTVEDEFAKLLADVERIKAGPAPAPRGTVLEEVSGAPGWVRVTAEPGDGPALTPPPPPYYWNVGTGQLSWTSPVGRDALKSLDMTRTVVKDAAAALQVGAPAAPPAARRAAAAEALARLLDALGTEQRRGALEQMGTPASRVWCAVHSSIAAAVAALSTEATAAESEAPAQQQHQIIEDKPQPASVEKATIEPVGRPAPVAAAEEDREAEPATKKRKAAAKTVAAKGAASLMSRWAARQQEMAAAEEGGEEAEREEWRADQLRTGAAAVNSNFAPVFGDWRDRVRAQQQHQHQETPATTAPSATQPAQPVATTAHAAAANHAAIAAPPAPATAPAMPDLNALSVGLPPGWQAMWDPASGGVYYGNVSTSQTQWHRPQ